MGGGPLGGGPMSGGPAEKARDFKGTMSKLIAYLGQYKLSVIIVFFFAIASTISPVQKC
jgi:ATP-binding cassette subfamily B protein